LASVSLEGWIFMVGLRVFDVGALVVWLVWFFRLRDDDDDDGDDFRRGKDDGREPEEPCGPGGLRLPLPESQPWSARRRDGHGDRRGAPLTTRRGTPHRTPVRPTRTPHR
jgi:hypothetical protein